MNGNHIDIDHCCSGGVGICPLGSHDPPWLADNATCSRNLGSQRMQACKKLQNILKLLQSFSANWLWKCVHTRANKEDIVQPCPTITHLGIYFHQWSSGGHPQGWLLYLSPRATGWTASGGNCKSIQISLHTYQLYSCSSFNRYHLPIQEAACQ